MTVTAQPVWDVHKGDEDDTLVVRLDGEETLAGVVATVKGVVAYKLRPPVELAAAVTDGPGRIVTVQLGSEGGWLDSAILGDWRFVVVVTFLDGRGPLTWPERGHACVRVHAPV